MKASVNRAFNQHLSHVAAAEQLQALCAIKGWMRSLNVPESVEQHSTVEDTSVVSDVVLAKRRQASDKPQGESIAV